MSSNMPLDEAIDYIESIAKFTKKHSLDHTRKMMSRLGDPCADRKIIHVAGTNGKGSVCAFLQSILAECGISVGMFTSPHLTDMRERFVVGRGICSAESFLKAYKTVRKCSEEMEREGCAHPSYFEFLYGMGMLIFAEAQCEYIILETGLGGRLDATSSFPAPVLCIITSIGMDHMKYLGDTIRQIAAEKAGILKPGVPAVLCGDDTEALSVIAERAERLSVPYRIVRRDDPHAPECGGECAKSDPLKSPAAYGEAIYPARDGMRREDPCAHYRWRVCGYGAGRVDFYLREIYDIETRWSVPFPAEYQAGNAALAIAGIRAIGQEIHSSDASTREGILPADAPAENGTSLTDTHRRTEPWLTDEQIKNGIARTIWPGRMQEAEPGIYFDGAHNADGVRALVREAVRICASDLHSPLLLFAMMRGKDIRGSAAELFKTKLWESVTAVRIPGGESMAGNDLRDLLVSFTDCPVFVGKEDLNEAYGEIKSKRKKGQRIFCAGSLYLLGALMRCVPAASCQMSEKPGDYQDHGEIRRDDKF